jgi:hypothetical protein
MPLALILARNVAAYWDEDKQVCIKFRLLRNFYGCPLSIFLIFSIVKVNSVIFPEITFIT